MQKAILAKKLGMTQIFDETGKVIPVTVIEAGPNAVIQKKTVENDGYEAVQVGFVDLKDKKTNKPTKGHFAKAGVTPKKFIKEFRLDDVSALNVGDEIKADIFEAGEKVIEHVMKDIPKDEDHWSVEAEAKAMLVNGVLEQLPNCYLVAASGMAGMNTPNTIKTRKIMKRFYLCGDEVSDVADTIGLVAPRVMLCAAHQAHTVLRILAGEYEV